MSKPISRPLDIRRARCLMWLMSEFPLAFPDNPIPLATGIHFELIDAKPAEFTINDIGRALHLWTTQRLYLNALKRDAPRYNLQGEVHGMVTPEQLRMLREREEESE